MITIVWSLDCGFLNIFFMLLFFSQMQSQYWLCESFSPILLIIFPILYKLDNLTLWNHNFHAVVCTRPYIFLACIYQLTFSFVKRYQLGVNDVRKRSNEWLHGLLSSLRLHVFAHHYHAWWRFFQEVSSRRLWTKSRIFFTENSASVIYNFLKNF